MNARSSRSHSVVIVRVGADFARPARRAALCTWWRSPASSAGPPGSLRRPIEGGAAHQQKPERARGRGRGAAGEASARPLPQQQAHHAPQRRARAERQSRGAHVSPAAGERGRVRQHASIRHARPPRLSSGNPNETSKPKTEKTETVSAPSEESARSRRDLAEMRARRGVGTKSALTPIESFSSSPGVLAKSAITGPPCRYVAHRPASRIPTLPVSATYSRGKSRREISTTDDFRGLETPSSNEDASYFDEAIPNDAVSSDRVPYENENAKVSRDGPGARRG